MDDFIKNIRKKLSVENISENVKEDYSNSKFDKDLRNTLEKVEPNDNVDVDEITTRLNELSEQAKTPFEEQQSQKTIQSSPNILQKPSQHEIEEKDDPYTKEDNVLAFCD